MSGSLPTTRAAAQIAIRALTTTLVSRSQSMREQARRRGAGAHRWAFALTYGTMERADYWALQGFLHSQGGQYDTFTFTLPSGLNPLGSLGGTPLVNGAVAAGVSSLAIDGCSNNITGWGKSGDFFKVAGHSKVYRLKADANTNGSGQTTLSFVPALNAAVADNEAVTFSSVPFTVRLATDNEAELLLQPPTQGTLAFAVVERY